MADEQNTNPQPPYEGIDIPKGLRSRPWEELPQGVQARIIRQLEAKQ